MTPTVLYDEDCGICRATADALVRFGRPALRAVAIQGEEGQHILEMSGVPVARRLASMHFLDASGRLTSAGAAMAPLSRQLPFGGGVALLAEWFPSPTEHLYGWAARHRGELGRLIGKRACAVDPSRSRPRHPTSPPAAVTP